MRGEELTDDFGSKVLNVLEDLKQKGQIRREHTENGEDAWYLNE